MITLRKSDARGHAEHGWLDSYHTFSFANYYDAAHMGFRDLRVINEDRVTEGQGFGRHGHSDMEIISYVVSGKLSHRDSMGTVATLERGDVQVMSAGTGVQHSEFNGGQGLVRFLQIWILPDARGHAPRYQDRKFDETKKRDRLMAIASKDGRDDALPLHQDVTMFASLLSKGKTVEHALAAGRHAWLQVIDGAVTVGNVTLAAGDGAAISDERSLSITAQADSEILLFDLA